MPNRNEDLEALKTHSGNRGEVEILGRKNPVLGKPKVLNGSVGNVTFGEESHCQLKIVSSPGGSYTVDGVKDQVDNIEMQQVVVELVEGFRRRWSKVPTRWDVHRSVVHVVGLMGEKLGRQWK